MRWHGGCIEEGMSEARLSPDLNALSRHRESLRAVVAARLASVGPFTSEEAAWAGQAHDASLDSLTPECDPSGAWYLMRVGKP